MVTFGTIKPVASFGNQDLLDDLGVNLWVHNIGDGSAIAKAITSKKLNWVSDTGNCDPIKYHRKETWTMSGILSI